MARRLAVCFDGTWNTVKDHTNVSRIHAAIRRLPDGNGDSAQLKYYDEGVGTSRTDRIIGGVTGFGLSRNIRQGYAWLIEHYQAESELYLFGFSRGAFTARSLAGLIGRCGIPVCPTAVDRNQLRQKCEDLAAEAYAIYRGAKTADDASREFLSTKSREVPIHFIGVWDTVGTLGAPFGNIRLVEQFHDTGLGRQVKNAFHALAIDEHRSDYDATLWTENPGGARLEQRWFPGAHSNVGGGYEDDLLPDLALAWMAARARECGLDIDDEVLRLDGNEYRSPVRDSFQEFMGGAYSVIHLKKPFYRTIGNGVNEVIDDSAYRKWRAEPGYRPPNLAHAGTTVAASDIGMTATAPVPRRRGRQPSEA